ncbi:hypothetical protein TNCV_4350551 [Trichonephila clavipes]|nr:hypothetical protein TNCV_4350551 [Trichonephila clavipes]
MARVRLVRHPRSTHYLAVMTSQTIIPEVRELCHPITKLYSTVHQSTTTPPYKVIICGDVFPNQHQNSVPVYPSNAWGGRLGARISWTKPDFLVINFNPPVPRGPVDLLHPMPKISLNRHFQRSQNCSVPYRLDTTVTEISEKYEMHKGGIGNAETGDKSVKKKECGFDTETGRS